MGKPTSSLTTAISIRISNDLLDAVADHALSQGLINESGRLDKRGQPNLSAAISSLLKQALDRSVPATCSNQEELSDSVISSQNSSLETEIATIEHRLADRVQNTVAQQLNQFLSQFNAIIPRVSFDGIKPAQPHSQVGSNYGTNPEDLQEAKEDTKERIFHAASRGFRSHGYNGIGVNSLAKDAGVTSGAFYGYFRSKEDAFLVTVVDGLDEYRVGIETVRANHGASWLAALADYYMGRQHREDLASGCALPTLSPEVIRSDRRVRAAYQTELIKLNEAIAAGLTTGNAIEKRDRAWVILSLLTGGITLSRAVWDESLAEQIAAAIHDATIAISPRSRES